MKRIIILTPLLLALGLSTAPADAMRQLCGGVAQLKSASQGPTHWSLVVEYGPEDPFNNNTANVGATVSVAPENTVWNNEYVAIYQGEPRWGNWMPWTTLETKGITTRVTLSNLPTTGLYRVVFTPLAYSVGQPSGMTSEGSECMGAGSPQVLYGVPVT